MVTCPGMLIARSTQGPCGGEVSIQVPLLPRRGSPPHLVKTSDHRCDATDRGCAENVRTCVRCTLTERRSYRLSTFGVAVDDDRAERLPCTQGLKLGFR